MNVCESTRKNLMVNLRYGTPIFVFLLLCFLAVARSAYSQIQIPTVNYISTVAGNGTLGYTGDGGLATSAELNLYTGITAVDSAGNLYIVDANNSVIREVSASTGIISTFDPAAVGNTCGGTVCFSQTTGVAIDSAGNVYISQIGYILKWVPSTGILTVVAGNGSTSNVTDNPTPATNTSLGSNVALALDATGNIYIADSGNNRIRKVTASTGIMTTVAGSGALGYQNGGYSGDGGSATSAQLNGPTAVAVDASGNIYIADASNQRVRKVTASSGVITTVAGSGGTGGANCAYSGDGGLATSARLCGPQGVAVDQVGDLYIADSGNNVIREVISSTGIISTLAGNGTAGYTGDGGLATSAQLTPSNVSLDAADNVYVFDWVDDIIRVVGQLPPALSVLNPSYQVVSIVYAPPGNKSSTGYTSNTTNGGTTTLGSSFQEGGQMTFTEGFSFFGVAGSSASQSLGVSNTSTLSNAFQETFTDATAVSNASISTNPNTANHDNDEILVWLNPQVSVETINDVPASYSVASQPSSSGQIQPPDIIYIAAGTLLANASGHTTVDPRLLDPQVFPSEIDGTEVTLSGLAAVCKQVNLQEYQNSACTLGDQCGCQASDFTGIVAQDPLLNYAGTGNPYPGTVSPLEADASGAINCESPTPTDDCRYVPVPQTSGSSQIEYQALQGPQCSTCNNYPNTYTQTDATTMTQTLGGMNSDSVGTSVTLKGGIGAEVSLTISNTLTWQTNESTGTSSGTGNSQTVTLNSATQGCSENVNVYEDTVYHTFVFQEPTNNNSCP